MNDWSLAEQHAERAWRHYESGRFDHALRLLRRALSIQDNQAEWWFGLGLTLDALHRYHEAADAYRRVLDLRPGDAEAMLHLGLGLLRLDKPAEALEQLDAAYAEDPTQHACQCNRIAALAQLGEHEQAELTFYLAQQDEPDCPVCFDHVAHSLAMRGELPKAIWCWQRTLELDPSHPQARANTARAHWYLGQLTRARFLFERHCDEQPDDRVAKVEHASLLLELDELNEAERRLAAIIADQPHHATAQHLLGDLHIKRNQPAHAAECYHAARAAEPDRPGIDLGLALAAKLVGDESARARHLLAELDRAGQDARQVLELSRQLLDANLGDQVIALLSPMIDGFDDLMVGDDASLAEALRLRGLAMRSAGRDDQAIADCREAVRLCPQMVDAWRQLVHAYTQTGQLHRAIVCLNHAIDLTPDDAELRSLASKLRRQALVKSTVKTIRRAA
ncbi:MAG: tetratricopeptide repeat protein [Phycisphaeraceae bacterium]